jgi:hypothetical protein
VDLHLCFFYLESPNIFRIKILRNHVTQLRVLNYSRSTSSFLLHITFYRAIRQIHSPLIQDTRSRHDEEHCQKRFAELRLCHLYTVVSEQILSRSINHLQSNNSTRKMKREFQLIVDGDFTQRRQ